MSSPHVNKKPSQGYVSRKLPSVWRSSERYIWSVNDVLGTGVTSAVYQGIDKLTGEAVAIKSFIVNGQFKSQQLYPKREIDVFKALDHKNIVRLIKVEEEQYQQFKVPVLVMELCTGRSLYSMLEEDPENTFGISENEFLLVLEHITDGVKYLQENAIVHRDFKPGNIVRFIADDGSSIYKLTDFGAARELKEGETYQTMCGTEEYLNPLLFQKALLKKNVCQPGQGTFDLWSIGVTLYQAATGSLPFQVYGGTRRNLEAREVMWEITSNKESGVISGVQTSSGEVKYSNELPSSCKLSMGLQRLITPLLAGLMESECQKIWSYPRFFTEVSNILSSQKLFVFSVKQCTVLQIYLQPQGTYGDLQRLISEQTNIPSDNQILLYNSRMFVSVMGSHTAASDYPGSSAENPLLLFVRNKTKLELPLMEKTVPIYGNFPDLPDVKVSNSKTFSFEMLNEYILLGKKYCSAAFCFKRSIESHIVRTTMLNFAAVSFSNLIKNCLVKFKEDLHLMELIFERDQKRTEVLSLCYRNLEAFIKIADPRGSFSSSVATAMATLRESLKARKISNAKITKDMENAARMLQKMYDPVVTDEALHSKWKPHTPPLKELGRRIPIATTYVQKVKDGTRQFKEYKVKTAELLDQKEQLQLYGRLTNREHVLEEIRNEEINIREFVQLERIKFQNSARRVMTLNEEMYRTCKDVAVAFENWLTEHYGYFMAVEGLQTGLVKLQELLSRHNTLLNESTEVFEQLTRECIRRMEAEWKQKQDAERRNLMKSLHHDYRNWEGKAAKQALDELKEVQHRTKDELIEHKSLVSQFYELLNVTPILGDIPGQNDKNNLQENVS